MRKMMLVLPVAMVAMAIGLLPKLAKAQAQDDGPHGWAQWGQNSLHQGFVGTVGQDAVSILADKVYDPLTQAEEDDEGGNHLVHYQVPLIHGRNFFIAFNTAHALAHHTSH